MTAICQWQSAILYVRKLAIEGESGGNRRRPSIGLQPSPTYGYCGGEGEEARLPQKRRYFRRKWRTAAARRIGEERKKWPSAAAKKLAESVADSKSAIQRRKLLSAASAGRLHSAALASIPRPVAADYHFLPKPQAIHWYASVRKSRSDACVTRRTATLSSSAKAETHQMVICG